MMDASYYISISPTEQLHLYRLYSNPNGPVVFMLHGAIENGRIFYSNDNQRGLGPYLAQQGFDVYIPDLRGRGLSWPKINRHSHHDQTTAITEDIPAFLRKIVELRGDSPQYWVAHSWGGVLLSAYYARFGEYRHVVKSMVYFATKRRVAVWNWPRVFYVDLMWGVVAPLLTKLFGYLPAKAFHLGPDNETRGFQAQCLRWVREKNWIASDGFNYAKAISEINLPPILYLAGASDRALGHPEDVCRFMMESGIVSGRFLVLAKSTGYRHDYGHVDILTHRLAEQAVFPLVLDWFK